MFGDNPVWGGFRLWEGGARLYRSRGWVWSQRSCIHKLLKMSSEITAKLRQLLPATNPDGEVGRYYIQIW